MIKRTNEKRIAPRIRKQLRVSIKSLKVRTEAEAKSIDIAQGGIGVSFDREFLAGDKLELWIHFADGLEPIHRFGRLVWVRKLKSAHYIGGIKFESMLEIPL